MTRDFGFFYKKEGDTYQHINMRVSVVDANGQILNHIYGIDFRNLTRYWAPIYHPDKFKKVDKAGFAGLLEKSDPLLLQQYDPATNSFANFTIHCCFKLQWKERVLFSILFFVWKKEIIGFFSRFRRKKVDDPVYPYNPYLLINGWCSGDPEPYLQTTVVLKISDLP